MNADPHGRPRLVVAVADVGARDELASASLGSAVAQTHAEDAVLWVSPSPPPSDGARWVRVERSASAGDMYGEGLQWAADAEVDVLALTDSCTRLEPGWRGALDAELAAGAVVVGGPVRPADVAGTRTRATWAGFLVDYATHAVAPFRSATGDVSGNNVAYAMRAVRDRPAGAFWKSAVDRELRDQGHRIAVAPEMVASSMRTYTVTDLLARSRSGRRYASQVAEGWPVARRIARVLLCAALPLLRLVRLARVVRPDPALRRALRRSVLLVACSEVAWSAGEAHGYAVPVAGVGG